MDVQLEQLASDTLSSPGQIIGGHLLEQRNRTQRDSWDRLWLRFVAPGQPEEVAMPAQHSIGLDDQNRIPPEIVQPSQRDQHQSITPMDMRLPDASLQDDQLLSEQRILGNQIQLAEHDIDEDALNDFSRACYELS